MEKWCRLGSLHGTPYTRYGIVRDGSIVSVLISRPDGTEVPMDGLKWKVAGPKFDTKPEFLNAQVFTIAKNGQQARTSWRRGGKAGAA